jgi:hypothetical protein
MITLSSVAHRVPRVAAHARWTCALLSGLGSLFASEPASRLTSLSSFAHLDAVEAISATGFVVAGPAEKFLLVRSVGPGLRLFGLTDGLPDPVLRVVDARGRELSRNDGWRRGGAAADVERVTASVGAFPLAPDGADAALLVRLVPGAYTLTVASASNRSGAVLTEVYETDSVGSLANVATIAGINAARAVFFATFRVIGTGPQKFLIRAVGPSLGAMGVGCALADPKLTLFNVGGAGAVARNDDWQSPAETDDDSEAIAAATVACGAFALPAGSKDAAVLVTLEPGAYTAQVTGNGSATGLVLLEVYRVP